MWYIERRVNRTLSQTELLDASLKLYQRALSQRQQLLGRVDRSNMFVATFVREDRTIIRAGVLRPDKDRALLGLGQPWKVRWI